VHWLQWSTNKSLITQNPKFDFGAIRPEGNPVRELQPQVDSTVGKTAVRSSRTRNTTTRRINQTLKPGADTAIRPFTR
jgi:hypothetical protein